MLGGSVGGSGRRGGALSGRGTYSPAATVGALPQWSQNLLSRGAREREVEGRARVEKGRRARRERVAGDGKRGTVDGERVRMPCWETENSMSVRKVGERLRENSRDR